MKNKQYLSEEKYQKTKKKISVVILIVFIVGISVGGLLLYNGFNGTSNKLLEELTIELENKKSELIAKGVTYSPSANYTDGEKYDLHIIINALDPSINWCKHEEYKNNNITKEYCSVKEKNSDFNKQGNKTYGIFIVAVTCMICGVLYLNLVKNREVLAYTTQQGMPIVKEGIEQVGPSIGKVAKDIKDSLKDEEK